MSRRLDVDVAIIGGGLVGSSAALALRRMGFQVALLDKGLCGAQASGFWSGTEGAMPDRNPVIGPSATTPGLIHAFGFSGAGFQIAPGVGEVVAELIRDGSTRRPIEAFSIKRFAKPLSMTGAAPSSSINQVAQNRGISA